MLTSKLGRALRDLRDRLSQRKLQRNAAVHESGGDGEARGPVDVHAMTHMDMHDRSVIAHAWLA